MKLKYFIFPVVIASFISSCGKYLDIKPDKKLVIPSDVKDLQALLDFTTIMNKKAPSFGEASADNYYLPENNYDNLSLAERQAYTWSVDDYSYANSNDWSNIYDAIGVANTVLDNIDRIPRTSENGVAWDNAKGSALVFRAQSFLRAAWIFCKTYDKNTASTDYGIVLRTSPDFNVPSKRSSVEDTYNWIIKDLKGSVPLLPDYPVHVMRPSKQAAYALLARTYLSMRKYDSCQKYADLCLQLNSALIDYNDLTTISSLRPFMQFNKEDIFHSTLTTYSYRNISPVKERVDTVLYDSYLSGDLRKEAFFYPLSPGHIFKGTYNGNFSELFIGIAVDEVYLMRAECNARRGDKEAALKDLNALMIKRWKSGSFTPFTAATAEDALKIILTERRKELIFRGLRWMDIKRLNKEGANITLVRVINGQTYNLPPNDNGFALPLPSDIIDLTGMPQNPH